ncbi:MULTISPECIES: hypothetical protein [Micromonospora]|uniref:hypothetical protein n=1 Tax=Micromonospora TaxID=1873 RepID=UPI001AE1C624|nr:MULTISPECIES: hypothetical protein [unclassified Micromonospora]MBP1781702.1 hypothetical protein [Micromonospora sp. HB375]MBQ1063202.1 hypothetical protein [Micromonospora sp. C41]MDH6466624.1 hypothetical protein [Micromonospora sp. H404/HB375]
MDEELGKAAVGILVAALGGTASAGLQAAAKKLHSRIHAQLLDVDSDEIFERWAGDPRNVDRQGDLAAAIGFLARDYPDFERKLRELIEEARALSIVHEGNAVLGDQVSSVVTASGKSSVMSGNFHGDAQIGDRVSKSNNFKFGGGVLLVGLLAIFLFYIAGQFSSGGEITQDSTCQEFLEAPSEEALRGLRKVGTELGVRTGSPLAPPAISYACSGDPDARLGDVVLRYKGQF